MGGELQKKIDKALDNLEETILAIRSIGGYKFRKEIPMPDKEIDRWVDHAIKALRQTAVNLLVAEAMLKEKQPSILAYIFHKENRQPRWAEYQQRRRKALTQLGKK